MQVDVQCKTSQKTLLIIWINSMNELTVVDFRIKSNEDSILK